MRLSAVLKTVSQGVYYQSWDAQAVEVTAGVSVVLTGQATDATSELDIADGWWQVVRGANSPNCAVSNVQLDCPGPDAFVITSNVGGVLGKVQCHNTVGDLDSLALATFQVTC